MLGDLESMGFKAASAAFQALLWHCRLRLQQRRKGAPSG